VLAQLHRLPEPARNVAVAAAVLGIRSSLADVARVADSDDVLGPLEQAASVGLVSVEGFGPDQHVVFAHPLVRAAIYYDLGPALRAELHRLAATTSTDVHARLRHREAAATGPDAELSQAFVELAEQRVTIGNMSQAARAWASAGRLHPDRPRRERLLAEAAACHVGAGEISEALTLSEDAKAFAPGPVRDYMLSYPPAFSARPDECFELIRRAWDGVDKTADPRLASYIAIRASTNMSMHSPLDDLETWAGRALELDPTGDRTGNAMFALAVGLGNAGRYRDGLEIVDRLRERPETSPIARERWLLPRGLLRFWADDVTGAHADLVAAADTLRRNGPTLSWLVAMNPLIDVEFRLGRWDDAIAHAELGVSAIADLDFIVLSPYMSAVALFPSASRGDWVTAERHLATAKRARIEAGGELNVTWTALAQVHLAAARGDHEGVLAGFAPLLALGEDAAWADPAVLASRDLHAEALVALGRLDEAQEIVDPLSEAGNSRRVPSMMAAAARVRGMLEAARGNDVEANSAFSAALDASPEAQPFRRALIRYSYGAFLRREGRRREAETHLTAAHDTFEALAAAPYIERANRELAATGLAPQRRRAWQPTKLTPQETAVVHLARSGYTNKEIGSELVISVRTVEYHLKNAYQKLGVSSRRELIRSHASRA
jgi:DNA-binding CsgD family transcriptional regulator